MNSATTAQADMIENGFIAELACMFCKEQRRPAGEIYFEDGMWMMLEQNGHMWGWDREDGWVDWIDDPEEDLYMQIKAA